MTNGAGKRIETRDYFLECITSHITGSKKQSEERAALFDVRVHVIVGHGSNKQMMLFAKNPSIARIEPKSGDSYSKIALERRPGAGWRVRLCAPIG